MGDFLPGDRSGWSVGRWWQVSFALIVTVALTVGGVHWLSDRDRPGAGAGSVSLAQGFADAALAAFSGSSTVTATGSALTAGQRSAGLPTDPVAGLTSNTAAGPVQVVLPGGLGAAQHTSGGQVVYPDTGAGFDMLAENTATGTRTVARINTPGGVRMVTTFVRTPADTVMLAHTNGYLTINRATPTAETVGMFAPAETRDATGRLVPSSYVARQLRPGLYQLSEVIDPRPDTVWPVFVDPPLHVGGMGGAPLPAGLFDSFTSTISSAASAVGNAVTTAASATVSGAKAVGTFVKNNPMETAIIVAGAAVAVTGVGGPAGAAAIAAAVANVSAAGLQIASEAMPDNQALGVASTLADVATMFTPTGAAKKIAEETAEVVAEQALKHTDDIIDATKVVPNPAQVREEIAAAGAAGKPPLPGVGTPKAPNAPPAVKAPETPATPLAQRVPCAGQSFSPDTLVLLADGSKRPIAALQAGDRVWSTDPDTGRTSGQAVAAVLVNHDTDLLDLTITNPADVTSVVHTTAKHPFYSPVRAQAQTTGSTITGLAYATTQAPADTAGWVDATDLRPGDQLATPFYDSAAHVAGHTQVAGTADMWDLTIETTHTFYIATPTANVLVHNCPMSAPGSRAGKTFTQRGKDAVWQENGATHEGVNRCEHCGTSVVRAQGPATKGSTVPRDQGQVDHIRSRASGGSGTPENGQVLCAPCNNTKRTLPDSVARALNQQKRGTNTQSTSSYYKPNVNRLSKPATGKSGSSSSKKKTPKKQKKQSNSHKRRKGQK
ncbi:HNH endonuclease [Mycolicibacterium fluoranthenivorans]|uniref:HNH endonuclease n=1 Tax=Mycolicibacterium fluoranthenivorans TaxID=258505 RepID=A0A7G8PG04_9MYCO|nr:polymorphic toxin-type HINT domain-containing protein [Mycolicibacterium fluoranthenivorans]QNJ93270.1 HNH endonuclease [Mycolicibacterium fluoranthenivorans]